MALAGGAWPPYSGASAGAYGAVFGDGAPGGKVLGRVNANGHDSYSKDKKTAQVMNLITHFGMRL